MTWLISMILKYALPGVLGNLTDDIVNELGTLLQTEITRRQTLAEGAAQQHTADLQASTTEARNAATIDDNVRAKSDAALDAELRSVQPGNAAPHS